jgi:hypothetical protein
LRDDRRADVGPENDRERERKRDQAAPGERGKQHRRRGRALQDTGDAYPGEECADPRAGVGRDRAPERSAKRTRHARAHHAYAPKQERDTAEGKVANSSVPDISGAKPPSRRIKRAVT